MATVQHAVGNARYRKAGIVQPHIDECHFITDRHRTAGKAQRARARQRSLDGEAHTIRQQCFAPANRLLTCAPFVQPPVDAGQRGGDIVGFCY